MSLNQLQYHVELAKERQAWDDLFEDIEGYEDLKGLLRKMLESDRPVNIMLVGPPASGKTVFLTSIQKAMTDTFFIDSTNASGAGIVQKLFNFPNTKYLLVDEIEKMTKPNQNMLLNLLENGELIQTKIKLTNSMYFEGLKVFATSNDVKKISKPLRSRFLELHLPEYTEQEFIELVTRLAQRRFDLSPKIGRDIAHVVWHKLDTRDVRDALQIAGLVTNGTDVSHIASVLHRYRGEGL